jgi:protocatechuate 3,4-dioxygenase beta subunit
MILKLHYSYPNLSIKTNAMKLISFLYILIHLFSFTACSQNSQQGPAGKKQGQNNQHIGGRCEGCEAVFESPVPFEKLGWIDTLPDFNEAGPKMMISGVVYHADGKTPARDVVLYIYHTGQDGKYTAGNNEKGWGKRHGYIRGWMKTNEKGEYKFYTLIPASYPNSTALKHIHPVIKEPGKNEYYIDEYVFDDDPFLTPEVRAQHQELRGGSGLIKLKKENGLFVGQRNIYLGRNIPGYPTAFNYKSIKDSPGSPFYHTSNENLLLVSSSLIPRWDKLIQ